MGFFSKLFQKRSNNRAKNRPREIADYRTTSTVVLGTDSTAFKCIDNIASQMAMLNFGIYSRRTRQKVQNHPFYALLKRPNLETTRFMFIYQSVVDYFDGGIYWLKGYSTGGQLVSLFRLNPKAVTVSRDEATRQKVYKYNGAIYTSDDIVYIPSRFGYSTRDGGLSIFDAAINAFDTSYKLDLYTKNSFASGATGKRLVMDISQALPDATDDQVEALREKYESEYSGVENAGKMLLKKKGVDYGTIDTGGTDNRAAELTENRKFQEHEMGMIFSMPDDLISGTSSDLENPFTLFLEFAIKPLATQIQEAIDLLLTDDFYFEFDFNGVMKVSLSKRIDAYTKQINNGILTPNEARRKENLPPLPEAGDTYFMPANLMPLNKETIDAYMAKQKKTAQELISAGDNSDQHSPAGDDKQ